MQPFTVNNSTFYYNLRATFGEVLRAAAKLLRAIGSPGHPAGFPCCCCGGGEVFLFFVCFLNIQ